MDNQHPFDPLQAMLSQLNNTDPQIKQIIEQQYINNQAKKRKEEDTDEQMRRFRIQNKKLLEQLTLLKEQQKQMKAEQERTVNILDYFLKLTNSLSAALGSCDGCWGEDTSCEKCGGEGGPGWRQVNKRMFTIYVQPCLEKVYGQNSSHSNGSTPLN
jgi:hypothetical protein